MTDAEHIEHLERALARADEENRRLLTENKAQRDVIDGTVGTALVFRAALEQIDRHVVGACDSPISDLPEPCDECGEMREIASQALARVKERTA